ncbi:MAG TPA: SRPBCC family protein [Acidimicrobiales bacterium]|nr:SRPBCC family protein [Acidimicrobiales bacterium]
MELSNEFVVPVAIDDAWAVLTDVERIAPCMPGARLESIEGDDFHGVVKVKVGPVTVEYKGTAQFLERDATAHKAVLKASGRETRGQGNATATVTAELSPEGDSTRVAVRTELDITGRVAQFGRGMLADVSTKLLGQFVDRLERDVLNAPAPSEQGDAASPAAGEETVRRSASTGGGSASVQAQDDTLDLGKLMGKSALQRVVAPLVGVALGLLVFLRRRRAKRRG